MPGINDAFKKHCAESSDAGSILPDWRQEPTTPESPPDVVPAPRNSFSDSSESGVFQIVRRPTRSSGSASPPPDDPNQNPPKGSFFVRRSKSSAFKLPPFPEPPFSSPAPEPPFPEPPFSSPTPEPPFSAPSVGGGLRTPPPLWGVDLALILISVIGLAAIALHFEEVLMVLALCLYRLLDAAIWIVLPLFLLLILFRVLLRRR